ncbi:MAG: hypothetical protein KBT21_04490 [Treponema sp.]|nr:hypothetical protein [Candidatus Treponema merdequi]
MNDYNKVLYVNKFIRAYPEEFSLKEFIKSMSYVNCEVTNEEALEIVESSPYIFQTARDKYISRAAVFSNRYFSFVITKEECENKCFIPGHRLIPFVDQEILACSFSFFYEGVELTKKNVEFSKDFALEHFSLYGEEYESQYIANDFGMKNFSLSENNFELPQKITLWAVDLSSLFEKYEINAGDRILLAVENWDEGFIRIEPVLREKNSTLTITQDDIERNNWYKNFEKFLLEQFNSLGPRSSIEEQIADVFFEHIDELTKKNCGSVEEFIKWTKAVSVECFGVETRLWRSGETVPAIGMWNEDEKETEVYGMQNLLYSVPDYILDEYLKDYAFQKKTDINLLIKDIFPKTYYIPEESHNEILLHIANRNDIILKNYNWFADQKIGDIRNKALVLYTKISTLVYDIDRTGGRFGSYPQQELVILIQLYTHLAKLVETISYDAESVIKDIDTINCSLDGMRLNFEDIEMELKNAVMACKKRDFKVIR